MLRSVRITTLSWEKDNVDLAFTTRSDKHSTKQNAFDWYSDNAINYGFPYTPMAHALLYRNLKERAINDYTRNKKGDGLYNRVVSFTGVRRAESRRRSNRDLVYRSGARITVNAIVDFTNRERDLYLSHFLPWYSNPYYATVGNSGDCQLSLF